MAEQAPIISYPIPAYQNLPIRADFYSPSVFTIEDIDLGVNTLITTSTDHNYVVGQQVRVLIPPTFGSYQLNNQQGIVLEVPASDQVLTSIDSSVNVNEFISATPTIQSPQIVAIGDVNQGYQSSTGTNVSMINIPGSFINIS